jgi:hypothetical protein
VADEATSDEATPEREAAVVVVERREALVAALA